MLAIIEQGIADECKIVRLKNDLSNLVKLSVEHLKSNLEK